MKYKDLRKEYMLHQMDPELMNDSPFDQFRSWFDEAISVHANEANAMVLSTVNHEGRPSSRYLLLKEISERGFVFFTNYNSRKGLEMESNPFVCLVFYWRELERQVRIEGKVEKIKTEESIEYFNSRPLGSRISAIASPQSQRILSRKVLEDKIKFLNEHPELVTMPDHWGGFLVVPDRIEFWQGRESRLHDRISYTLNSEELWEKQILAP
ncbi:MAG: pyridoxamine 5'-phosphate oxidase [Saprospiraceae bacterium]|nr:pyridoxamine 5'-phosphate oxidase [Candidatus Vicinibacter proximus]MBL7824557.1 pyridoxamine 5'-phosphate oxidase [Saprospiraceae bacterium]MCC6842264.1 pyridoxamine 5'-phosphate oxidase [Saprospiraceae bacterium]HRG33610.1 pyridoxamine 5'-phosphate oxidase [Saprospiraceae bacterium]